MASYGNWFCCKSYTKSPRFAKKIERILHTEPTIQSPAVSVKENTFEGDIVFDNISFTYAHTGIQALKNFSLTVKRKARKFLILGRTGSGKIYTCTTLLRFYDLIKANNNRRKKIFVTFLCTKLRDNISYVPQDIFLSVIRLAAILVWLEERAGQEQIISAAKMPRYTMKFSLYKTVYENCSWRTGQLR
jgi:ATP-binding cassette subfamily B protein